MLDHGRIVQELESILRSRRNHFAPFREPAEFSSQQCTGFVLLDRGNRTDRGMVVCRNGAEPDVPRGLENSLRHDLDLLVYRSDVAPKSISGERRRTGSASLSAVHDVCELRSRLVHRFRESCPQRSNRNADAARLADSYDADQRGHDLHHQPALQNV